MFFFNIKKNVFIYFWLHRVLVAARGLFIAAHGLSRPAACGIPVL